MMNTRIVVVTSAKVKTSNFLELIANIRERILTPKVEVTATVKEDLLPVFAADIYPGDTESYHRSSVFECR